MGTKQAKAPAVQGAVVAGRLFQRSDPRASAVPLLNEPVAMLIKRSAQGLKECRNSLMLSTAKGQTQDELVATIEVQFTHERNIAIRCLVELPIHLEILGQVCPAITSADVSTRNPRKWNRGTQRHPGSCFFGHEDLAAFELNYTTAVAPPSYFKMGRTQGIETQIGNKRFITS